MLTSEPDMIDDVSVLGSLGRSDHNILSWTTQLRPTMSFADRAGCDYSKADYPAMRQILTATDWSQTLQGDANAQWTNFASLIQKLVSDYIPPKKTAKRSKKASWMSYKAAKLIDKKHQLYNKYKSKRHPAYAKAAREAQTEMRRAKRSFEKKLAKSIDTDRKSFYAYVNNRSRANHQ